MNIPRINQYEFAKTFDYTNQIWNTIQMWNELQQAKFAFENASADFEEQLKQFPPRIREEIEEQINLELVSLKLKGPNIEV